MLFQKFSISYQFIPYALYTLESSLYLYCYCLDTTHEHQRRKFFVHEHTNVYVENIFLLFETIFFTHVRVGELRKKSFWNRRRDK